MQFETFIVSFAKWYQKTTTNQLCVVLLLEQMKVLIVLEQLYPSEKKMERL